MLHGRAADWLSENGYVDTAIDHALAAGRSDRAASLVQASWMQYFDAGLGTTVRSSASGPGVLNRRREHPNPGDSSVDGGILRPTGRICPPACATEHPDEQRGTTRRNKVRRICRGADPRAVRLRWPVGHVGVGPAPAELETDGNTPWYAVATTALGHANYVIGDLDTAARVLPNVAYSEAAPSLIRIMALASLSLTQAELGQFDRSRKSAEESMEVVEARSLRALPSGSMAFTALGQSQGCLRPTDRGHGHSRTRAQPSQEKSWSKPVADDSSPARDGTRGDHVGGSAASTAAP